MCFMKVSIITVCLNNEDTIRDSIDSVLSQTYGFIEYLIVDGGSTDSTLDIVYSYGDRIARVISEPDEGIYDAMNKGIRNATGDIVATLNADDFYIDDEVISDVVGLMQQTGAEASIGDLFIVDQMDVSRIIRYCDSSMFDVSKFAYGWMPPHPGFSFEKCGMSDWGCIGQTIRFLLILSC
jgi:glycosyltransferase involved in cell wall biosynthesis